MSDLAVYDMDRTVTRSATYTPFLLHCALRRAPWRLLLLPFVIVVFMAVHFWRVRKDGGLSGPL